jgi:hypothetical protein
VLRRIFAVAVKKRLVTINPCSAVEFPVRVKGLFPSDNNRTGHQTAFKKVSTLRRAGVRYFRLAAVDFAVKHGLQYIEYDAGWYGPEGAEASDATRVSLDPARVGSIPNHGGLDLAAVIAYAKQRGIGVFLYVNRRALERQIDTIFPLYEKWGVAGVKIRVRQRGPPGLDRMAAQSHPQGGTPPADGGRA